MLTLSGVTKTAGGKTLFADASLHIHPGERLGVVGANGVGKSTLLALILGQQTPDAGEVILRRGVAVGHLGQETAPVGHETVLEIALAIDPELFGLRRQMRDIELGGAGQEGEPDPHTRFRDLGGFQIEAKAKKILTGLGFRERDFERSLGELSGGWVMRAHLARLLVQEPDLLMLDEPTNHLDLEALIWLQNYLKSYPGGIVLISHDREFLNQLVTSIVEIRRERIARYRGNYDDYLAQRAATEEQHLAAYKNQQREVARLMRFVERFRAKNTKASQAQSKLKQIERMERIEAPASEEAEIDFRFPQPPRSGLRVISLKNLRHRYGQNVVYERMQFEAQRGQRIVLVGPNGAGKSTLLKLLAGVLPVQDGSRDLGHNVKLGYYSQYRVEMLSPERTVLEEALETPQRVTAEYVRTVLGCFLFRGDDVFKRVSVLSGGEKSRLALVKLLLDPPNLLLMDEPTTHLDMSSIDALLYALHQYTGTLVFISHDVHFIRSLANHVTEVKAGHLQHYPGSYQYYLDKTAESVRATEGTEERTATVPLPDRPSQRTREQKRQQAEERQARSKARREQGDVVMRLERQIHGLETRQIHLTQELERPETHRDSAYIVQINRELAEIARSLNELTSQWEAAALKLAKIEASLPS